MGDMIQAPATEAVAQHQSRVEAAIAALPEPARELVARYRRAIEVGGRCFASLNYLERFVADVAALCEALTLPSQAMIETVVEERVAGFVSAKTEGAVEAGECGT